MSQLEILTPYVQAFPFPHYDVNDWYWGHPTNGKFFSSWRGCYVSPDNEAFVAWCAKGNRPQDWPTLAYSGQALWEAMLSVLAPAKLDPASRVQKRLDEFAKQEQYDDILAACSYANSTDPIYAAQGRRAIELRDATWSAYVEHQYTLADNWPELVLKLPVLSWE